MATMSASVSRSTTLCISASLGPERLPTFDWANAGDPLVATALAVRLVFDLFSWWLIEILGKEKRYGRSGRFMNSLDVPIEIGRKSVNQFASKTTFQGCGGRAIIAYGANDLPGCGLTVTEIRPAWYLNA